jgi:hypothetical protein
VRLGCFALSVKHADQEPLLPQDDFVLAPGDELLFCGRYRAADWMDWTLKNDKVFAHVTRGERPPPRALPAS